jgi:hypothetical protein
MNNLVFMLSVERNTPESQRQYWSRPGEKVPGVFADPVAAIMSAYETGFLKDAAVVTIEGTGIIQQR